MRGIDPVATKGRERGASPLPAQRICFLVAVRGTMWPPGETEPSSAGTQLGKGYSGLRCAQSASGPCRLALPGAVFLNQLGHRSPCLENPRGAAAYGYVPYVNVRTSQMNPDCSVSTPIQSSITIRTQTIPRVPNATQRRRFMSSPIDRFPGAWRMGA